MEDKKRIKEDDVNISGGTGQENIVNKIEAAQLKIGPNSLIKPSMVAYGGPCPTTWPKPKNLQNLKDLLLKSDDTKEKTNLLISDPSDVTGIDPK